MQGQTNLRAIFENTSWQNRGLIYQVLPLLSKGGWGKKIYGDTYDIDAGVLRKVGTPQTRTKLVAEEVGTCCRQKESR